MPAATLVDKPTLQLGSEGADVIELQNLLNLRLKPFRPNITPDGDFGDTTQNAVLAYQEIFCLPQTGIAAKWTWNSLLQTSLSDIKGHWAADFILQLFNAEVLHGDDNGKFNPDAPISRAQVASILVEGFSPITLVRSGQPFSDVPEDFWASGAIQNAFRAGFMSGFDDGTFKSNLSMLRQDVIITLAKPLSTPATPRDLSLYGDRADISDYAKAGIIAATSHKIVVNHPSRSILNPKRNATRAEVAAMFARARTIYAQSGKPLTRRVSKVLIGSNDVV
jgi:peptidoglycan hydrolase-like protein with peptidoglycan-binding domain